MSKGVSSSWIMPLSTTEAETLPQGTSPERSFGRGLLLLILP
jgi:hypothetical protein